MMASSWRAIKHRSTRTFLTGKDWIRALRLLLLTTTTKEVHYDNFSSDSVKDSNCNDLPPE
jgi:hypothetical protein